MKKVIDVNEKTLTITFDDGSSEVYRIGELSPDVQLWLMMHGASQKIGDAASGGKEIREAGGNVAEWQRLECGKVWANLRAGEIRGGRVGYLARAIATLTDQPVSAIVGQLSDMTPAEKKALSAEPSIALKIQELKTADQKARLEALKENADGSTPSDILSQFKG